MQRKRERRYFMNQYWGNITEIFEKQKEKGVKKYGQVLEENTSMTIEERIVYAQEELIDGLMYLEHLKNDPRIKALNICKWLHDEVCCNNKSNECADFPSKEVCMKCKHREVDMSGFDLPKGFFYVVRWERS